MPYDHRHVEPKWQAFWDANKTFEVEVDRSKPKFYALDMFPYPSAKGLHVGHPAGYTASDVVCRLRRAQGFNVLHPMGFDSFGLPAEQRAIEEGVPPQRSTADSIENFRRQLKRLGFSYDWSREISTADPSYYKWTQWIFTQLYEQGLAYQADMFVNWCPALGTVLANDEVIDGKSERGGHPVIRQKMRQWMLRITRYADPLLAGLDTIDWPEATKTRQREWIGRSEGARIRFPVVGQDRSIEVFTTRPDTLWGATYMVVAPEHPIVAEITAPSAREAVEAYVARTQSKSELDRQQSKEKTGVDTGARAKNPATGAEIPIWIADYVIYGYGTGAIMAVPAHDERDFEFATVMRLPIVEVISGGDVTKAAHTGEGRMVNSGPFDGTPTAGREAVRKVIAWLVERGLGEGETTYKLRDWTFSRQRYWGEPIPVLKEPGGEDRVVRVLREEELPLELPAVERYAPLGTGESPLAAVKSWVEVEEGGRRLRRETDTMPGSAGSSWYFLRYCDPRNSDELAAREATDYWMPVDLYVGGAEHTVGHLMYARMWQRFLAERGIVRDVEPFQKLVHQGMILAFTYYDATKRVVPEAEVEERGGKLYRRGTDDELVARVEKMSKRKGNVVNPDEVVDRFGTDAMRVYICFMGPLAADKPWQTNGLEGQHNWLKRLWRLYFDENDRSRVDDSAPSDAALRLLHKTIKKVTADIESLDLNTAISALHVATRELAEGKVTSRAILGPLCQLVQPFAPHLAEELWASAIGRQGGISFVPWPKHDDALAADDVITMGVQILGKTRGEISIAPDADEATALAAAEASPAVARYLEGKVIQKVIYKPGKILNLIVKP